MGVTQATTAKQLNFHHACGSKSVWTSHHTLLRYGRQLHLLLELGIYPHPLTTTEDLAVSWMMNRHDQCSGQCKQSQILGFRSKTGLGGRGVGMSDRSDWLTLPELFFTVGETSKLPGFSKNWFTDLKCQENDSCKWVGRVRSPEPGWEFSAESSHSKWSS